MIVATDLSDDEPVMEVDTGLFFVLSSYVAVSKALRVPLWGTFVLDCSAAVDTTRQTMIQVGAAEPQRVEESQASRIG